MVNCIKTDSTTPAAETLSGPQISRHALFFSPLAEKIRLANVLYSRSNPSIPETDTVNRQLLHMKELLAEMAACMAAMDLAVICTDCSLASVTGGCCSSFMADENDAVQLLINLLAGVALTENPHHGEECTFLGATGCVLDYKPFFCLNYLCQRIRENSAPALLNNLEKATGKLLQAQFAMEGMLLSTHCHAAQR